MNIRLQLINWINFFNNNYFVWYVLSLIYFPLIDLGSVLIRNPVHIKKYLIAWNLTLWVCNFYCFVVLLFLVIRILRYSDNLVCNIDNVYELATPREIDALVYFCLLKIPEMFDTMFIVLRAKPVTLLHKWHHWSVMLYCYIMIFQHSWRESLVGIYFGLMNACVHSIMYMYYAILAMDRYNSIRRYAKLITKIQIGQFIIGIIIQLMVTMNCNNNYKSNIYWSTWVLYGSYLVLFVEYYNKRYKLSSIGQT